MRPEYTTNSLESERSDLKSEIHPERLESISKRLGFIETTALQSIAEQIKLQPEHREALLARWLTEAQRIVEQLPEEEKINAQIGAMVSNVSVYLQMGFPELAKETFEEARQIASCVGISDLRNF